MDPEEIVLIWLIHFTTNTLKTGRTQLKNYLSGISEGHLRMMTQSICFPGFSYRKWAEHKQKAIPYGMAYIY